MKNKKVSIPKELKINVYNLATLLAEQRISIEAEYNDEIDVNSEISKNIGYEDVRTQQYFEMYYNEFLELITYFKDKIKKYFLKN